jgi:hypothetical protein
MYIIHKIKDNNENLESVLKKYYGNFVFNNYENFFNQFRNLNEKNLKYEIDNHGFLKKEAEILIPEFFIKHFHDHEKTKIQDSIRFNSEYLNNIDIYNEKKNILDNIFFNLNFCIINELEFNYLEYNNYYNINKNYTDINILKYLNIDYKKVDTKIDTFSYPNFYNHILIYKQYGAGRILFVPHFYFIQKLNINHKESNDNYSKEIFSIMEKHTSSTILKYDIDEPLSKLKQQKYNILNYIDLQSPSSLEFTENDNDVIKEKLSIIFEHLNDDGCSLIVLLNKNSNIGYKSFFSDVFGISVSNERNFKSPNFHYKPLGIIYNTDNYAEMNVHYQLTMAELNNDNLNNANNNVSYLTNEKNFKISYILNDKNLIVKRLNKYYHEIDVYKDMYNMIKSSLKINSIKKIVGINRIRILLRCLYSSYYELFKYILCNNYEFRNGIINQSQYNFFRLYYRGQWNELIIDKINFLKKDDYDYYIGLAIYKLMYSTDDFKTISSKSELKDFLNSKLDMITTFELISLFYGFYPILENINNLEKEGFCLIFKNDFDIDFNYYKKSKNQNLDNNKIVKSDDESIKNVWFPLTKSLVKKSNILYQYDFTLEFNNNIRNYLNYSNNLKSLNDVSLRSIVNLNFKTFNPIFIPEYFKSYDENKIDYDLNIWIYSDSNIPSLEYSKYKFTGDIFDLNNLTNNNNFSSSLIILKECNKISNSCINLKLNKDEVFLLLIYNKNIHVNNYNRSENITIRVCSID